MDEFEECPRLCLENKEIVRCSSAGKVDNYVLFRDEALKKSATRGERFRRNIKKKYANLGVKKANWTELGGEEVGVMER